MQVNVHGTSYVSLTDSGWENFQKKDVDKVIDYVKICLKQLK